VEGEGEGEEGRREIGEGRKECEGKRERESSTAPIEINFFLLFKCLKDAFNPCVALGSF